MAQRGKPSTAHRIDPRTGQCIYCHMHKVNIEMLSHVCTPLREKLSDEGKLPVEESGT